MDIYKNFIIEANIDTYRFEENNDGNLVVYANDMPTNCILEFEYENKKIDFDYAKNDNIKHDVIINIINSDDIDKYGEDWVITKLGLYDFKIPNINFK